MKTLKVVRALSLAFISIGAGYTPYAAGNTKLVETQINISGLIEAETCSAISMNNENNFFVTLPAITMKTMQEVTEWYDTKSLGIDIEFSCPSGLYANLKFASISDVCLVTPSKVPASCGGKNTSVGVLPSINYPDYQQGGKNTNYYVYNNGNSANKIYKVSVDAEKKGKLHIGKNTYLARVAGRTLEPGELSTSYLLILWVD